LQTVAVSTGLLFALLLLVGVYALYVGLNEVICMKAVVQQSVTDAEDEQKLHEAVETVVKGTNEASIRPVS
jgi:hypothetical protein